MAMRNYSWAILVFIASFIVGGYMQAQATSVKNDTSVRVSETINDDAIFSGDSVEINSTIKGELVAAGQSITLAQKPERSFLAAGNDIHVDQGIGYNGFLAGNTLTIKGEVGHDLYLAGNDIVIDPSAHIKGALRASGRNVTLGGTIDGDVALASQLATSNATVGGSFKADTSDLRFTGGAISKDLVYRSNQDATGLDQVKVIGKTERTPIPRLPVARTRMLVWFWTILSGFLAGAAIILLSPKKLHGVTQTVSSQWPTSLLYGFLGLIGFPIIATILFATYIGIPLGLIAMFGYLTLLYMSYVLGQIILGGMILVRLKQSKLSPWIALVVGVGVMSLLSLVPYLNWLVSTVFFFGLVLPTFGGILIWWRSRLA